MATVHLGGCQKVKTDIAAVRLERAHLITEKAIEGAPDLVVEIVSESTRRYDLGEKRKVYGEAGVGEIWLVDFEREQVTVFRRVGKRYRSETKTKGVLRSQVLKGFSEPEEHAEPTETQMPRCPKLACTAKASAPRRQTFAVDGKVCLR